MKTLDEAIVAVARIYARDAKLYNSKMFPSPCNDAQVLAIVYDEPNSNVYPRLRAEIIRQIENND